MSLNWGKLAHYTNDGENRRSQNLIFTLLFQQKQP